jgi:hypothetical protein
MGDGRGGLLESPIASNVRNSRPMLAPRNGRPGASNSVLSISHTPPILFLLNLSIYMCV